MNRTIAAIATAALAALPAVTTAAQTQPVVNAAIDSVVVTMGSTATMTVEVTVPADAADRLQLVDAPVITDNEMGFGEYGGVQVVAIGADTTETGGRSKITNTYTLQAFNPGLQSLPAVGAVMAGSHDTVRAANLTLKVLPVDVDTLTMALMPMAGTAQPQMKWHDYIPLSLFWILAAALLIAAGVFLWMRFRRKRVEAFEVTKRPVPPYELAIDRLSRLRASGIASAGNEKRFYTELTEILRQYLHGRFGINAMEMTSPQILRALRRNPETRDSASLVQEVLVMADFVKFAKERPLADDNERAFSRASAFVESTKPLPPPPVDQQIRKEVKKNSK